MGAIAMTHPFRVLVADDQAGVRLLLTEVLQEAGLSVVTASDGKDALRKAAEYPPDLALLDLKMPSLDGVDVLEALRLTQPGLPVVVMTALEDSMRTNLALQRGAALCITKPFDIFYLRDQVLRLLNLPRSS